MTIGLDTTINDLIKTYMDAHAGNVNTVKLAMIATAVAAAPPPIPVEQAIITLLL